MATGKVTHNALYLEKSVPGNPAAAHSMLYPDSTSSDWTQKTDAPVTTALPLTHLCSYRGWQKLGANYQTLQFDVAGTFHVYHLMMRFWGRADKATAANYIYLYLNDWGDFGATYGNYDHRGAALIQHTGNYQWALRHATSAYDEVQELSLLHIRFLHLRNTALRPGFMWHGQAPTTWAASTPTRGGGIVQYDAPVIDKITLYQATGGFFDASSEYMFWGEGDKS